MSEPAIPSDVLPDNFLLNLMARQSLQELVRLGQVNVRWRSLAGIVLRRVTRLNVFIGTDSALVANIFWLRDLEYVQVNGTEQERARVLGLSWIDSNATITFVNFGQEQLQWLTASMPHILDLTIVQDGRHFDVTEAVHQLTTLINHWCHNLTSLAIYSYSEAMSPEHGSRLFASINGLTRLQDLFLKLSGHWHDVLDLPILARISRFVLYSGSDPVACLLGTVRRYASVNQSLQQIHLGNYVYPYMPRFSQLVRDVSLTITGMIQWDSGGERVGVDEEMFDVMCTTFTSITYLRLLVEEYTPVDLVDALACFPKLYYLHLNLMDALFWFIPETANPDADHAIHESVGSQLDTIQVLYITVGGSTHHQDFASMYNWSWSFPSLRVVRVQEVYFPGCAQCRIAPSTTGPYQPRPRHCTLQLLAPFKHCPLLRQLSHNSYDCSITDL